MNHLRSDNLADASCYCAVRHGEPESGCWTDDVDKVTCVHCLNAAMAEVLARHMLIFDRLLALSARLSR